MGYVKKLFLILAALLMLSGCNAWDSIDIRWHGQDNADAHFVAECESNHTPTATNPAHAVWHDGNGYHWGLFQIWGGWDDFWYEKTGHTMASTWMDPYYNAWVAWEIWLIYGWDMWMDICVP